MKGSFLPFVFFIIISSSCEQKFETWQVPKKVLHSFKKQHPTIEAEWEVEDSVYEAAFKTDSENISLLYNKNGDLLQSEKIIMTSELPEKLKNYLSENYKDQKISKAKKVTKNSGEINYETALNGQALVFNEEGKFIKRANH